MATNAGYSETPLIKKLGIKDDWWILLIDPPADYFDWLQADLSGRLCGPRQVPDFVHLFAGSREAFEKAMPAILQASIKNPRLVIWVSWYKKSSGRSTNLSEDFIRHFALANGLVDIKVCAVSKDWSGLKLVVPVAKR